MIDINLKNLNRYIIKIFMYLIKSRDRDSDRNRDTKLDDNVNGHISCGSNKRECMCLFQLDWAFKSTLQKSLEICGNKLTNIRWAGQHYKIFTYSRESVEKILSLINHVVLRTITAKQLS
jgi:hypothetical protein